MTPAAGRPGFGAIALLTALIAVAPMNFAMFSPAIAATAQDLRVPAAAIQGTLSAYLLVLGLAQPVYGPITDRYGRKHPMIVGYILFILGSVICALSDTTDMMMAGRVAQALGVCAGMVSGRALVRDWFGPERTAAALAAVSAGLSAAPAFTPLLGAFLADTVGWRGIFWVLALYGALLLAFAVPLVPDLRSTGIGPRLNVLAAYARLFGSRLYMGLVLNMALQMGAFFAFMTEAPFVLSGQFGLSVTQVGLFFAAPASSFVVGALIAARVVRRSTPRSMILIGNAGSAIAASWPLINLVAGTLTVPDLLVGAALVAFMQGFCFSPAQAVAISIDARIIGTASGLMGTLQMVSCGLAVLLVGALHDGSAAPAVLILVVPTMFAALVGWWGVTAKK